MKTRMITGALMVFLALASLAVAATFPNVQGEWEGSYDSGFGQNKLVLRLNQATEKLTGGLEFDRPPDDPTVTSGRITEKGKVTFTFRGGTADVTLQLSPDGNKLTGTVCISQCRKLELTRKQ